MLFRCKMCGGDTHAEAGAEFRTCASCGTTQSSPPQRLNTGKSRMACGLAAIFLGWLGVHKFMLGYTNKGIIMLIIGALTAVGILLSWPLLVVGIGILMKLIFYPAGVIMVLLGIIDGIMIFTKEDYRDANGDRLRS